MAEIDEQSRFAAFALGSRVLEDSNLYCKEDTGTLKTSAVVNSSGDLTTVQWVTPYAAKQYYLPSARLDKNPKATSKWFETAKGLYLDQWIDDFAKGMKRR